MYHIFFIHSSVSGCLGCFHVPAMVNSAAMNKNILELLRRPKEKVARKEESNALTRQPPALWLKAKGFEVRHKFKSLLCNFISV